MKAVNKGVKKPEKKELRESCGVTPTDGDGVIPVLFPMDTWRVINEIGDKLGMKHQEVIALSIERLHDTVMEVEDGS